MKIYIQKEWYSVEICKNQPKSLFIFGDNTLRVGKGGQAIIRDLYNSTGIATKFKPTMESDAFFSDTKYEYCCQIIKQDIAKIITRFEVGEFENIVFPVDGLGTGLARLKYSAPKVFNFLAESLRKEFGINTLPTGKLSWGNI